MHNVEVSKIAVEVINLGGYFAGGYARWEYLQDYKPYGDVDVFCTTSLAFERLGSYMTVRYGLPARTSQFALTWEYVADGHNLQLIRPDYDGFGRKLYGDVEDVIREFDFTVIAVGYNGNFVYHRDFLLDNSLNELRWLRQPTPTECLANYQRLMKYARKGFGVPVITMSKLFSVMRYAGLDDLEISDLDINGGYDEHSNR